MTLLGIEKTLQQHPNESGKNFYNTYSVLLERLLQYEYTQTSAEFDGGNCHGPNHIRRVLKKLDELLGDQPLEHLGIFDLWVAMMATIYHDVGLLRGRDGHPKVSQEFMLEEKNSYIFDSHERELIATAIFTHGGSARIEEKCKKYPKRLKIGDFTVNLQRICALVRLADELDEDYRRGDEELFRKRQIAEKYPTSVPYWAFNQRTRGVYIEPPSSHRREVQIQMALHRNDLTFIAPVRGGGVISFVDFTINKLRKINAERVYCNEFLPEPLRLTHMSLLLLPIIGCEDLWDTPQEISINDNDTDGDLRIRLPAALTRAPSVTVPAKKADHPSTLSTAANIAQGLPPPEVAETTSNHSPYAALQQQLDGDSKKKLTNDAPFEAPSDKHGESNDQIDPGPSVSLCTLPMLPQHAAVRCEEREAFKSALERKGIAWLIAEWGLGSHEFLASCFADAANKTSVDFIRINCELGTIIEQNRVVKFSLDTVLAEISKSEVAGRMILLDHIPTDDVALQWEASSASTVSAITAECERFAKLVNAALPSTQVVLIARRLPSDARHAIIELEALDESDCRRYVATHAHGSEALTDEKYFDRIYSKSEGIPTYIDRMLDDMRTTSIEDVLDSGGDLFIDGFRTVGKDEEFFNRSIQRSLGRLQASAEERVRRSVKLLKSLTVLSYGETFGVMQKLHLPAIKRIDQSKPFYPKNVDLLQSLGLLKIVSVVDVETAMKKPSSDAMALSPKVLLVPKQIREYISRKLLTEDEHRAIACSAMEMFFGERWRDGEPATAWVVRERSGLNTHEGSGIRNANPRAVIVWLLRDGLRGSGPVGVKQILLVGELYFSALHRAGRFRDIRVMSEELIRILDASGHFEDASKLYHTLGFAMRMLHEYQAAVAAQERALKFKGQGASNHWQAQVHLELAEAHFGLKNRHVAISHAEDALKLVRPDSGTGIHAQEFLLRIDETLDSVTVREQLKQLESKARKKQHHTIANNIALRLANNSSDPSTRLKIRNRVIATEPHGYNAVRATVAITSDMVNHGQTNDVAEYERRLLNSAYSYLHDQRISLFDECHDVIWQLEKSQKNVPALTRIYQLSAALWRSTGKSAQEIKYIGELNAIAPQEVQVVMSEQGFLSLSFSFSVGGLFRRMRSAVAAVPT